MNKLIVSLLLTVGISGFAHAAGDAAAGQAKAAVCGACHGPDGNSMAPNFPKLAGQGERYLTKQLHDIKSGKRTVLEMTGLLTNLSDQDLADIAAYYASQSMSVGAADPALVARGAELFRGGKLEEGMALVDAETSGDTEEAKAMRGQVAMMLNSIAWAVTDPKQKLPPQFDSLKKSNVELARKAVALSNGEDGQILDTLAFALAQSGNYKEAAEIIGCPMGTLTSRLVRGREVVFGELAPTVQHRTEQLRGALGHAVLQLGALEGTEVERDGRLAAGADEVLL